MIGHKGFFQGETMHNVKTIFSNSNLFIDLNKLPEGSKNVQQLKEEMEKKNSLEPSFLECMLSPGCCVI